MRVRPRFIIAVLLAAVAATAVGFTLASGSPPAANTPIKHLVVIFDENESFDHYFGTYPNAANPPGEPAFTALSGTPIPNNYISHPDLLTANPNLLAPQRLDRSVAVPCGQNHSYGPEQGAANGGAMNMYVQDTGGGCSPKIVMNYYDGNTVTALWNYAQHFAMSDNFFDTTYGPSTPGAINLISGNTHGVNAVGDTDATGSITADPDPVDDCGSHANAIMTGPNIGDSMNTAGMTWGWFQGGFKLANCHATHANLAGGSPADYSPHHEPFQYYASTANPTHAPPGSVAAIGTTDAANHQYDLSDFDAALAAGNLPQVSYLKPPSFEDGHPGNSGPLDEQRFIVNAVNEIEQSPDWDSTAIIITYDDSDGWYDHVFHAPTNTSLAASDQLTSPGHCGDTVAQPPMGGFNGRCGPGPRLPFLVVSPWAKQNYIDHTYIDQTSIMRFIEDNWNLPQLGSPSYDSIAGDMQGVFDFAHATGQAPKLTLDATTGLGPGGVITPGPTPTTTTTPAPPPTTTTTGTTTPKPPAKPTPFKPKLSFSTKKTSKSLRLTFKVTGLSASKGKITVSAKLTLGKKTVASAKGTVRSGKVTLTLKSKKKLKRGTYKLSMTVSQAGKSAKFSKTLHLH